MKLKVASLKNPRARIVAGDWVTYPLWKAPDGSTPVAFKVSGISTEAYVVAGEEMEKAFALEYKGKRVPDDVRFAGNAANIAGHLLHDWRGLDADYSPEAAEALLTDRDNEAITDAVLFCAREIERVTAEFVEDAIKNSAPPSVIS